MLVLLLLVLPVVPEVQVVSEEPMVKKVVLGQWVSLESSLPCQSRLASNLSQECQESLRCHLCH